IALRRRSVAPEITARELPERFFDIEDARLREPLVAQDERGLLVAVRADAQDAAHRERRQNVYSALPVRRDPRSRELRVRLGPRHRSSAFERAHEEFFRAREDALVEAQAAMPC